jgi:Brp/Blh family beta-carotene 15,15'-monooxygenase
MKETRFNFILIYLSVISLSIYPWVHTISYNSQIYFALALIFLFGIPHGAIDHVIFFEAKQKSLKEIIIFYVVYLGLIAIYTVCWFLWPYYSLIFFILISAFHFGQSQFNFISLKEENVLKLLVYLSWGSSLLLGLTYFHYEHVNTIFQQTEHFANFGQYLTENMSFRIFIGSTILSVLLILGVLGRYDTWHHALQELANFALLHFVFYLLPPLVGFTVYFVFWHSIQVMIQEYGFLKKRSDQLNLFRFIKILTPHSLISIVGALLLIFFFQQIQLEISPILLVLIFLSVLTLPHSIVMNRMYGH